MSRTIPISQSVATVVRIGQPTIAVTEKQMLTVLGGMDKGNTFVTIVATTEPKMNKTGNPFLGNCYKTSRVNGSIQFDYENNVNAQRAREGEKKDFVAQKPSWGTRLGDSCIIEHDGKYYIYVRVLASLAHAYHDASGNAIDAEVVKPFLAKRKQSQTQGTEKEIIVRKYTISNIREMTVNGQHYEII